MPRRQGYFFGSGRKIRTRTKHNLLQYNDRGPRWRVNHIWGGPAKRRDGSTRPFNVKRLINSWRK